jgi:aspartyl-tRNA(Asn)/glutamyl-tRNA(Gln) amidotransferase subunit C
LTEPLSQDEVAHVAHLARIDLNEAELEHFADHLGKVLEHASELDSLDLESISSMSHPRLLTNVMRDDVVGTTLDRAEVLEQAPDTESGHFRVPSILGETS